MSERPGYMDDDYDEIVTRDNEDAEHYAVSDERLAEIRGLIDWSHVGWQTIPKPGVTVYDLAAAVADLIAERDA